MTYNGLVFLWHSRLCGLLGWLLSQSARDRLEFRELQVGWKTMDEVFL